MLYTPNPDIYGENMAMDILLSLYELQSVCRHSYYLPVGRTDVIKIMKCSEFGKQKQRQKCKKCKLDSHYASIICIRCLNNYECKNECYFEPKEAEE